MKYYITSIEDTILVYPEVYITDNTLLINDYWYPIYKVNKGAKIEDIMTCLGAKTEEAMLYTGLLFSSRAMNILQKFRRDSRIILLPVIISYRNKNLFYYLASFRSFNEGKTLLDWCDFSQSQLEVFSFFKKVQDISLSSKEDWINFKKLHDPEYNKNFHLRFKEGKLILKEDFYKEELDFIWWDTFLSGQRHAMSERLAEAFIKEGISSYYKFKSKEILLG